MREKAGFEEAVQFPLLPEQPVPSIAAKQSLWAGKYRVSHGQIQGLCFGVSQMLSVLQPEFDPEDPRSYAIAARNGFSAACRCCSSCPTRLSGGGLLGLSKSAPAELRRVGTCWNPDLVDAGAYN